MTSRYQSADARWQALISRQATADGHFVYAVKTTGVYCRPTCASRRPLRKNVVFFGDNGAAAQAGFRPCLRCRPTGLNVPELHAKLVVSACRLLESERAPKESRHLAATLGVSPYHFQRVFKQQTGVTPQEYRRRLLAERAKNELLDSDSVTEAVYAAGYGSQSRFYAGAARELGMSPTAARAGAAGQALTYAVRQCSLGRLIVAWSARGLCELHLGDSEPALVAALTTRFPEAKLARARLPPWLNEILALVDRPQALEIPLDIQGTAFQQRVWQELRNIPVGQTRTYTQVASAIGAPRAVRAVASACASNSLAVVIPCHRVVRSDGQLAGYRWGLQRKRALLQREKND